MIPARSLRPPAAADVARTGAQFAVLGCVAAAAWWGATGASGRTGGAGTGRLAGVVIAVGGVCTVLLLLATLRGRGRVRASWAFAAGAVAFWAASTYGAVHGWPAWLSWGVLRGVGCPAVMAAMLAVPEAVRRRPDWALLLLDGWLLVGSALEVTWVSLTRAGSPSLGEVFARHDAPLYWLVWDVAAATVIAGLTVRVRYRRRMPVLLIGLAVGLAAPADLAWAATGDRRVGAVFWLMLIACLAASMITPRLDIWSGAAPDLDAHQLGRPSHVAVVPGLLAAAAGAPDAVTVGIAVSLLLGLGLEIAIRARAITSLWRTSREQAQRLATVLGSSRDAIVVVDPQGFVEYANPACEEVLGIEPEGLLGSRLGEHLHPDDLPALQDTVRHLEADGGPARLLGRYRRPNGAWRHIESTASPWLHGEGRGVIMIARDVEDRVRLEGRLRTEAETDSLTGLLNRQAFLTALDAHLGVGPLAVLFCDLDGFKGVNDTEGHAVGDSVLRRAADRITDLLRPGMLAARLGGDEFAVLVPPGAEPATSALAAVERAAEACADALITALARTLGDGRLGVSIGIATSAGPGCCGRRDQAAELLRDADLAMYEAKGRGGGTWVRFEAAMRERVLVRSRLRAALEHAVAHDGLAIDLQPIADVVTGAWVQFEALVRWPDGDRRRPPAEFLPVAEESGLMVPLGAWVLRASLAWLATWPDADAGVSVNVTGAQVASPGFLDVVRGELERHGLAPGRLTLEITEQTAVDDLDRASAVLQPLRSLGVHVALDDFGTGYCSLGYLAGLPVDELKIDRQFVEGLGVRAEDDALVRAVLGLAADLGLRVVAEGVETEEQAAVLRRYGCPLVQGFLYARPTPSGVLVPPGSTAAGPAAPAAAHGVASLPRQDDASRRGAMPPERV